MSTAGENGTKATNYQLYLDVRIYAEVLLSFLINRVVLEKMQGVAGFISDSSSQCEYQQVWIGSCSFPKIVVRFHKGKDVEQSLA